MNPPEIHAYLNSFLNFESILNRLRPEDFYLERIDKFLDLAGHPARNLKIIHVAGTKGKGSTCAFLAGILQESGYKVGLYTSPHLHNVNERIRILSPENARSKDDFSGAVSDEDLSGVLTFLRPFAASIQNSGSVLTYFEVLTVAALCHFANSHVDAVILETGLGGRLDATNAVDSAIAVITPVSFDHTQILGSTLAQIASEKSGIIKNSLQKVVIAPQEKEAMDMILDRCKEFGIQPLLVDVRKYEKAKIGLKGRHQIENAATAVEAAEILKAMGFKIEDEALEAGLKNVRWPGRFELLRKEPQLIVDCAHNGASAQALAWTMKEEYPERRVILVLGISQDKDMDAICDHLSDNADHIILTKARHPRSHGFTQAEGSQYFDGKIYEIIEDVPKALDAAMKTAGPNDVILVTGSIFVVAEAREYLAKNCEQL